MGQVSSLPASAVAFFTTHQSTCQNLGVTRRLCKLHTGIPEWWSLELWASSSTCCTNVALITAYHRSLTAAAFGTVSLLTLHHHQSMYGRVARQHRVERWMVARWSKRWPADSTPSCSRETGPQINLQPPVTPTFNHPLKRLSLPQLLPAELSSWTSEQLKPGLTPTTKAFYRKANINMGISRIICTLWNHWICLLFLHIIPC